MSKKNGHANPQSDKANIADSVSFGGRLSAEQMVCRLDVVFGEAFKHIVEGDDEVSILSDLCAGIVDALALPFMWLERSRNDEMLLPVAMSGNGPLHDEIHRLPERDDDSVLGDGPAVRALRSQTKEFIVVKDEGFKPWRKAAEKQKLASILAIPMQFYFEGRQQDWVVLFAASETRYLKNTNNQLCLQQIVERLSGVCHALCVHRQMRIVTQSLKAAGNSSFITDSQGTIIWANKSFCRLSGHDYASVIGRNPRILKSGKQGFRYYNRLWQRISSGNVWSGETVDRDSEGELYTIRQTVSPVRTGEKITHYISIHDDITDEKSMQLARERARRIDELTGLMTPGMFTERYERAVASAVSNKEPLALLLITINDFESLMATLGRDIEEMILETLGDRIRCYLSELDFAANLSGGDFAVVLNSVSSREEAKVIGEEILEVLNEPFPLLGDKLYLSRGLGVAVVPDDANDPDDLMRAADARAAGKD